MIAKKILIIEDEKVLLDVLRTKLKREGYEVATAENGEEGLRQVRDVSPDIILLDIVMPRMNGYEVLEQLNREHVPVPPIIIMSNSGQPVEIDRAQKLGARDFIIKAEFTPNEVIDKVKALLGDLSHTPPHITKPTPPPPAVTRGSGVKVLVIEDDQFLRDLLRAKLEREHFQVTTAIDVPEGV